jgi:hypothetical protein
MTGYITVCYSDQTSEIFKRGVMKIKDGKRTEYQIYGSVADMTENKDYYVKPDPNFENWIYSKCHKSLRKKLNPKDILFFRTRWHNEQYFIGYFVILSKSDDELNPICYADRKSSLLINGYKCRITPALVETIIPGTNFSCYPNKKRFITNKLSRNYLMLTDEKTYFLKKLLDSFRK